MSKDFPVVSSIRQKTKADKGFRKSRWLKKVSDRLDNSQETRFKCKQELSAENDLTSISAESIDLLSQISGKAKEKRRKTPPHGHQSISENE